MNLSKFYVWEWNFAFQILMWIEFLDSNGAGIFAAIHFISKESKSAGENKI